MNPPMNPLVNSRMNQPMIALVNSSLITVLILVMDLPMGLNDSYMASQLVNSPTYSSVSLSLAYGVVFFHPEVLRASVVPPA